MQPNSPLQPLGQARPVVPGVPQVPNVPQIPKTPETPAKVPVPTEQSSNQQKPAEPPKITGISMPAGANKKPESPTQRSNKINAANAPKPQDPEKKQKLLHKPVTMEEVEAYRRKSAKKKRRIFISIVIFIVVAGLASAATVFYLKNQSYEKLSSVYNKNLPIAIRDSGANKTVLYSQNGKKLSDKYQNVSDFESDRSLAQCTQDDKTNYAIISSNGKEIFSTTDSLTKINAGQNYILASDSGSYLLNKDGAKLSEKPLKETNYNSTQGYFLVADDSNYAIINKNGEEKITGTLNKTVVRSFSYAKNAYEDNYYCALIVTTKNESKLHIYNCESAKEITNIEDVYYVGGFNSQDSSLLSTERGTSYIYNNEMIYNSESSDTEFVGGIIKRSSDEKFFNPVTKKTTESFPTDSLIAQDKYSEKTSITEDCKNYDNHKESKLVNICSRIYFDNKLLDLDYDRFDYYLLDEKLDNFLSLYDKHYFYRRNKSNQKLSIIDANTQRELYADIRTDEDNMIPNSRFVVSNNNPKEVIELSTGKTAQYPDSQGINIEKNYYIVRSEQELKYYNAEHKEISKE